MPWSRLSRRTFLAAAGAASAGLLIGCGSSGGSSDDPLVAGSTVMYRRSTKNVRASRAAMAHAANRVYPTAEAAAADPAHPGDRAGVVPLDVTRERWLALFGSGAQVHDYRRA